MRLIPSNILYVIKGINKILNRNKTKNIFPHILYTIVFYKSRVFRLEYRE